MATSSCDICDAAIAYHAAGLSVLPAHREQKYPAIKSWKPYQNRLPSDDEIRAWFGKGLEALCIVTGTVSGNLEMIDFDLGGEAFEPWCELVRKADASLLDRLIIEQSPTGGRHRRLSGVLPDGRDSTGSCPASLRWSRRQSVFPARRVPDHRWARTPPGTCWPCPESGELQATRS